ncbi:2-oxo acid dehydrogenase subunit E2 [Acinetobacter vivianii]|uniref:2-oxo acid dehydrogenase subunit E2 n=1 Tax=Acinetobacter vivianii TaxID=1776742 RepID=UPI002DB815C6|nr:2-oxo acid dehydrogenase subunit E2 [Acinetobacter vivianii]MEB6479787.1 2-oxo acid dehydrogenase subunit E2 [Acinetobacter vivianii]MEB6658451.1 2-oxo acid dehydrogenase subunit E2 [Acinetobacter vivianii]
MQIQAPDIGVDKALVAEILVKVGDHVAVDDSLLVLESDKATVEVPSTAAGIVKSILVKQGDEVTEGVALIELESESAAEAPANEAPKAEAPKAEAKPVEAEIKAQPAAAPTATASQVVDVKVPDIGVEKALVAEVLVKVGDQIEPEQSIVVVESDKATVEVPSSVAGIVEAIQIKEGDSIKEGVVLIQVKTASAATSSEPQAAPAQTEAPVATTEAPAAVSNTSTGNVEIEVPDLGVEKALVSEILVKVGDRVEAQQSLCVVESDKASVEVPSSVAGIVKAIHVSANQEVRQGVALATIEVSGQAAVPAAPKAQAAAAPATPAAPAKPQAAATAAPSAPAQAEKLTKEQEAENAKVYAGPAVRKLARELGVILGQVKASGEHGRVMKDDVFAYVKARLTASQPAPSAQAAPVASGLPKLPDFSAFGGGEVKAMTRLQQVSVPQLSLNNFIPQVTQFDLADITELEAWRGELKDGFKKQGLSLTILAFIAKAVAHLLKEEPYFAGHLADDQKSVLLRNEIHMGIAVATPDGLTVPVLRNPDQKSIKQIATELAELSQKARDRKLSPKDLQGANFTITSLGSIGGTAFTPLVNWPQVAILGISPAIMQPVWNGKDFDPRLMLPLSLSYDHRVINGADAARFTNKLTKLLKDIRSLLL